MLYRIKYLYLLSMKYLIIIHGIGEIETYLIHEFVRRTIIHSVIRIPYLCIKRHHIISCTNNGQIYYCICTRYLHSRIAPTPDNNWFTIPGKKSSLEIISKTRLPYIYTEPGRLFVNQVLMHIQHFFYRFTNICITLNINTTTLKRDMCLFYPWTEDKMFCLLIPKDTLIV